MPLSERRWLSLHSLMKKQAIVLKRLRNKLKFLIVADNFSLGMEKKRENFFPSPFPHEHLSFHMI